MTFQLFIRSEDFSDSFVKHSKQDTYKSAGEIGFAAAGYGNFYISHINRSYVPSREEQLLLDVKPKITKRQLTLQLAMED